MKIRRIPLLACLALLALVALGCSEPKTRVAENIKSFGYVVIPSSMQPAGVELMNQGVQAAAQELHVNATFGGTPFPDAEDQVQLVRAILQRPLKGMALDALDPTAQADSIRRADKSKAPVISFISDIDTPSRSLYVLPIPIEQTAEQIMTVLAMAAGGQGDVAVVGGARLASFEKRFSRALLKLAREPRFQGLRIRDTLYANDHPMQSRDTVVKLVDFYQDLRGIICTSPIALAEAGKVVTNKELVGKVFVTGIGMPGISAKWVQSGAIPAFYTYDPRKLGYLTLYTLNAAAEKRITGAAGETFTAGKLGKFTVQDGGVVLLGNAAMADRRNIADFGY